MCVLIVLDQAGRSRTKSFNPSTSFAVLCTVPSLLGAFSLGPSLVAAEDAGLGALCPDSSAPPRPLLLCFNPFDAPYCCGLNPLLPEPPAAPDREPFETFWWLCGVLEAGGDGMVGIAFGIFGVYWWLDMDLERDIGGRELIVAGRPAYHGGPLATSCATRPRAKDWL
jgi:hypothetical protein